MDEQLDIDCLYANLCHVTKRYGYDECVAVGEIGNATLLEIHRGFSFYPRTESTRAAEEDSEVRLVRSLEIRDLGKTSDSSNGFLSNVEKSKGNSAAVLTAVNLNLLDEAVLSGDWDLLTAIYLPTTDEASTAHLWVGGEIANEWTRGHNGRWTQKSWQFEEALDRLLEQERNGAHNEKKISSSQLKHEHRLLGAVLKSQRRSHSNKPYDRGEIVEWSGRSYQRCIPMDPCVPLALISCSQVKLTFDFPCQPLAEYINFPDRGRHHWEEEDRWWVMRGTKTNSNFDGDAWLIGFGAASKRGWIDRNGDTRTRLDGFLSAFDSYLISSLKVRSSTMSSSA